MNTSEVLRSLPLSLSRTHSQILPNLGGTGTPNPANTHSSIKQHSNRSNATGFSTSFNEFSVHTYTFYIFLPFSILIEFVLYFLCNTHTHTPLSHTCMVSLTAEVVCSVSRPVFYSSVPMALPSQRRPMGQRCTMPWKITSSLALNSESNEPIAAAAAARSRSKYTIV